MRSLTTLLILLTAACGAKPSPGEPAATGEPAALERYRLDPADARVRLRAVSEPEYVYSDGTNEAHWAAWCHNIDYGAALKDAKVGDKGAFTVVLWTGQVTDAAASLCHSADCIDLAVLLGEQAVIDAIARLPEDARPRAMDCVFLGAIESLASAVDAARNAGKTHALPASCKEMPSIFPRLWQKWTSDSRTVFAYYREYFV